MRYFCIMLLLMLLTGCNQISGADDFVFIDELDAGKDAGPDGGADGGADAGEDGGADTDSETDTDSDTQSNPGAAGTGSAD